MIDVFYEGGRKRGSVCSVRSDSNGRFRRSADVGWGKNPWRFWMLEFFTHKTSWQRSCSTQVCQTHFLVRPSAHNQQCGSINWNYFIQDEMWHCAHPPTAMASQQAGFFSAANPSSQQIKSQSLSRTGHIRLHPNSASKNRGKSLMKVGTKWIY